MNGPQKNLMKGAFITVEGADGAGKTTHLDFIQRWLTARGASVVRTREPGGTALGELLREILLDKDGAVPISDRCELLLIFAARAQHLDEVIVPALTAGKWVLCDRFTDATFAYQGGGRGIEDAAIATLERWAQGTLQPDLTVVLDVPVEVGEARTRRRGEARDRFERQAREFKQAVRRVYRERAAKFKHRIKMINADQSVEQVCAELETLLDTFWRERRV